MHIKSLKLRKIAGAEGMSYSDLKIYNGGSPELIPVKNIIIKKLVTLQKLYPRIQIRFN